MMMMKSIAQEMAPLRIRVNSIAPGAIRTPINTGAWESQEAYDNLMKLIPYKRISLPSNSVLTQIRYCVYSERLLPSCGELFYRTI